MKIQLYVMVLIMKPRRAPYAGYNDTYDVLRVNDTDPEPDPDPQL